jgi:hypothetical protein
VKLNRHIQFHNCKNQKPSIDTVQCQLIIKEESLNSCPSQTPYCIEQDQLDGICDYCRWQQNHIRNVSRFSESLWASSTGTNLVFAPWMANIQIFVWVWPSKLHSCPCTILFSKLSLVSLCTAHSQLHLPYPDNPSFSSFQRPFSPTAYSQLHLPYLDNHPSPVSKNLSPLLI